MILWEQKVSHKSGDVPFKNLNKLCWLIICLRLLINCYHSFLSLLFQFVWGLYISAPTAVDLQLNPSRASAVENVRISLHHGSWRGHDACSGSPHVWRSTSSTSWRPPTNSSSLPSLCFIFVFIKIAGSDFRCESLRCAIFPFTSFQNSHEIQLYQFTTSCKTTRRVVCPLVLQKTNNDVSSLFGSYTRPDLVAFKTGAIYSRSLRGTKQAWSASHVHQLSRGPWVIVKSNYA